MGTFNDIYGQEHIKEHFKASIKSDKLGHAYLITGENMAGKAFIADAFAKAVLCEDRDEDMNPCGKCHSCIQVDTYNHPDIVYVTHRQNTISVDDIRDKIIKNVAYKPYASKYKIFIMNEAQKMTVQAQNALLKTLEEPPEYVIILLLSTSKTTMLPTILSRCIQLDMRPVEDGIVRRYLMEELKVPDYKANLCIAFARGNIGKAKSLVDSDDFINTKDETVRILKKIKSMEVSDMLDILKKLQERKVLVLADKDKILKAIKEYKKKDSAGRDKIIKLLKEYRSIDEKNIDKIYKSVQEHKILDAHDKVEILNILKGYKAIDVEKASKENKININDFLDICMTWYRDILLYKSTQDKSLLIFKEETEAIDMIAGECSYDGIDRIINIIDETRIRLKSNANFELVMELMLLKIKEES